MRGPAPLVDWLDPAALARWVHDAPSKEVYRRRLAILWTADGRYAPDIARLLLTSPRTVRHWIRQFNTEGPTALDGETHGGRRGGNLSKAEERALLAGLRPRARAGHLVTAAEIRTAVETRVGHPVSERYIYDLLHRYDWRKVVPRPRHVKADPAAQDAFKGGSQRASNG